MKAWGDQPFQKIPEACHTTGLSQYMLRHGCRDGTIPHVKSGRTYYVNVPALLDKLAQGSTIMETSCPCIQTQLGGEQNAG